MTFDAPAQVPVDNGTAPAKLVSEAITMDDNTALVIIFLAFTALAAFRAYTNRGQ